MRDVDYKPILENINNMINTLEYDSMRSPGKTKVNAETLVNLYILKDRYESKAVVAPTAKKEAVVEAPAKKATAKTVEKV